MLYAWAIDFVRALYGMGKVRKFLFRIVVGKYAWREFVGMIQTMGETNCTWGYDLEACEYHKEKVKLESW